MRGSLDRSQAPPPHSLTIRCYVDTLQGTLTHSFSPSPSHSPLSFSLSPTCSRTPMKRLSYVAECASRPRTSCTPLQKNKHSKKHSLSTFKAPPPSSKRMPTKARQNRVDTENAPPCKCGLEESKRVGGLVGESATRPMNKKELRRCRSCVHVCVCVASISRLSLVA